MKQTVDIDHKKRRVRLKVEWLLDAQDVAAVLAGTMDVLGRDLTEIPADVEFIRDLLCVGLPTFGTSVAPKFENPDLVTAIEHLLHIDRYTEDDDG